MKTNFTLRRKAGNRLSRLHFILQQIHQGKRLATVREYQSVTRQLRRLAGKVLSSPHCVAKACAALALAVLFTGNAEAQCNTFTNADAVNPVINGRLPKIRKPVFVDIDGDGDLDCFAPRYIYYYSNPLFFKNTGTNAIPNYTYKASDGGGFTTGLYDLNFAPTTVRFADMDGDGDYDCFMSEAYNGSGSVGIRYFENEGSATTPLFVENAAKNPLKSAGGSYFMTFSLADIDGDGDIDAYTYDWYFANVYENVGTKFNPNLVYKQSVRNSNAGDRTYFDWDKDGLIDYFENNYTDADYYHNIGPKNNPQYVLDNQNGPQFQNGFPFSFVNLNSDSAYEAFNTEAGYSTPVLVPQVDTSTVIIRNKSFTKFTINPSGDGYTYQAYRNGRPIKGARSQTYIASADGVYSFTVSNNCGAGVSRPYRVKYSHAADAMATNEVLLSVNSQVKVMAYPNPFTSYLTLQLPSSDFSGTVQVTDVQGKLLINQKLTGNQISVGERLSKGIYVLKILQNEQVIFSEKIIKE